MVFLHKRNKTILKFSITPCKRVPQVFNPFLLPEKFFLAKKKIEKMALARPPSDAADCNFGRNHSSPRHKNWDALSREQHGGCGGGGSATARRWRQLGGGEATMAASAAVAAARQRNVGGSLAVQLRPCQSDHWLGRYEWLMTKGVYQGRKGLK